MSIEIILIGFLVGIANFFSRFVPIWLVHKKLQQQKHKGRAWIGVAMASIGVSAICAMFTIATLPPLIEHHDRIFAMSCGFLALIVIYALSKKIILATLTAALIYGVLFTYVHF